LFVFILFLFAKKYNHSHNKIKFNLASLLAEECRVK